MGGKTLEILIFLLQFLTRGIFFFKSCHGAINAKRKPPCHGAPEEKDDKGIFYSGFFKKGRNLFPLSDGLV